MKLLFNVTRFDMQYSRFIEEIGKRIAEEEILNPIKTAMKRIDYSPKIIDGTTIKNLVVNTDGFLQFDIVSEYNAKNFDVAKAREEGTKRHFVKPVTKLVLSWLIGNIRFFSKGHWVKGITKSNVIRKTIQTRFPIAQEKLDQATIVFFNQTVSP